MITRVKIYLDDNVPEYMAGILRCGSVETEDEDGAITEHDDLIDNAEFHSRAEMIENIAARLGVEQDIVEIVE